MRTIIALRFLAAAEVLGAFGACAATFISPSTSGFGNSGGLDPLSSRVRYQQVYQASDFLSVMPQGGLISQLAFRVDETLPAVAAAEIASIQLNFSTTQRGVNNLDTVFANNVGPNDTIVFGSGRSGWVGNPGEFAFTFTFQTPFLYDPRAGNLLLDVRNYSGASIPIFFSPPAIDAVRGRTSSRIINLSSVDAATANLVDSTGAVTLFTFTPVPEPSPLQIGLSAALAGLAMFVFQRWKGTKIS